MSLIPVEAVRGVDPKDGEPFYWRGWFDHLRCDGSVFTLRNSAGRQVNFMGRIVAMVCGRVRPPFKTFPRYYDLFLFEDDEGRMVCQRRWVSEAHEEDPAVYDVVEAADLDEMHDMLMNFDAAQHATNLWPDDVPGGQRRARKVREWIEREYADRVVRLIREATMLTGK